MATTPVPATPAAVAEVHATNAAASASAASEAATAATAAAAAAQTAATKAEAHASNWISGHKLDTVGIGLGLLAFIALLAFLAAHH